MLRTKGFLTKAVSFWNWNSVVDQSRVNLFHSRLILEALPVSLDALWCGRLIVSLVEICFDTVLCSLVWPERNLPSCCTNPWNVVESTR